MRFCQRHWDALRHAVESRGLSHLIAANGREAVARMKDDLEGKDDISNFDPLMACHWRIVGHVQGWLSESGGDPLSLYFSDVCPVCEVLKTYPPIPEGHRYKSNEEYFIDGPADSVLAACQEWGIDKPSAAGGDR